MSRRYFLIPATLLALSLAAPSAFASEKDELALVMRQLDQLQASLDRARSLSAQESGEGRFYFDYTRATGDIRTMKQGISQYLDPSRAQPRLPDGDAVSGQYRRERP
ncbi:integrative conjugative element protein, RAQPRD family [Salmonella enterica subsp. enterica]|uniref:Integrative conjugative element protein, RAQPRD family n=1 Tax=Salmonella enterica subsp. enterica serovar Java TaxID=224729 RepID=A0A5X0ZDQ0_SALEB|nr:integrative conjugative element protein, RAQPRD family [Salmonella enterica subsp. enterica serovar Java]EEP4265454.1 integrative conjugative element protein, RAQPRD family [Salmonella enterica subsp. enterica serovar Oranienburg]EGO9988873.1 integrative conjugative element protein, RAQPRD family [Salmonella enterica]EEP8813448.1 integrative conjugative element protein, RAQPRD family [Salmonella enterica subsp. enterica serovar Oranienburg]EJK8888430.1 integrative conjugative element protein